MLPTILSLFSWFNAGTFFHQAHHFVLQRLTSICAFLVFYTEAPDNSHIHYAKLADHVVHDALHDGEGAHYAPRCLPETRTKVQEEIIAWIDGILEGVPSSKKMLWLTGPAGAGKTAIAGTIADRLKEGGFHVATFFFSLSAACPDRQSTAKVASTLAYQLVSQYEVIKQSVLAAIERDPAIFDKRFDAQFKAMIIEPFCDAMSSGGLDLETSPSILLIDGVDECTAAPDPECTPSEMRRRTEATHKEILTVLLSAIEDWDLPFRFILASRPEPVILRLLSTKSEFVHQVFLDGKYQPDSDIETFLQHGFAAIRQENNIPDDWPPASAVKLLVESASGQFIYAQTVIRFMQEDVPQSQLKRILSWGPGCGLESESEAFTPLDLLYTRILRRSPKPVLAVNWILAINRLQQENTHCTPSLIKGFLESEEGETEFLLQSLNSLINVRGQDGLPLFHCYHKSLLDFLADPRRCASLHVSRDEVHTFIHERWKEILKHRGPLVHKALSNDFLHWYLNLSPEYRKGYAYTPSEMEWWLSNTGTVVLLLGRTGAGKSHFVNIAAGRYLAPASDSLIHPCDYLEIREYMLDRPLKSLPENRVVLVDTPGFDSTAANDSRIVQQAVDWLGDLRRRRPGARFGGIVYLYDITDDNPGSANLDPVLPLLKTREFADRFMLVSTKWDRVSDPSVIARYDGRETELTETTWCTALDRGSRIARFTNTQESAWGLLVKLLELEPLDIHVLQDGLQSTIPEVSTKEVNTKTRISSWKRFKNILSKPPQSDA